MKTQLSKVGLVLSLAILMVVITGYSNEPSPLFDIESTTISTVEFVQVLNKKKEETRYYYTNNWLKLRKQAKSKGFIKEYNLLETEYSEDAPFHFILITTFANQTQYEAHEENFGELIQAKGGLDLLNEIQPKDFRKTVFVKNEAKQLTH